MTRTNRERITFFWSQGCFSEKKKKKKAALFFCMRGGCGQKVFSQREARTLNLPVNSRARCQLRHPGNHNHLGRRPCLWTKFRPGSPRSPLLFPAVNSSSRVPSSGPGNVLTGGGTHKRQKRVHTGTRTRNLLLRRQAPYPLGHTDMTWDSKPPGQHKDRTHTLI